jgi:hypothetical protein
MKIVVVLVISMSLSGCVLDPTYSNDPNAIVKYGTLKSKHELTNTAEFQDDTLFIPVAGMFIPINIGSPQKEGSTYAHELITTDGIRLTVLSKFNGFKVGECLKIFREFNL